MWDFAKYGRNIALIQADGIEIRYDELDFESIKLAEKVGKRCLIFCLCRNDIGSVLGYSTFVNNGMVPVMLNANLDKGLLINLIEMYHPKYLWIPNEKLTEFKQMSKAYEVYNYSLLETEYTIDYSLYPKLALLLTTSGSTGSPKFVRQSYANIKVNTDSIIEYLKLNSSERAITTLPMNYTYGLSIVNTHLMVGATVLLTDKGVLQKEFWSFFKTKGATSFGGVPYTYEMLDRLRFCRMKLPTLRYMTQAGGKLIPELHKKFAEYAEENGKKFIVMYGQCEATARMGYLPADKAVDKCGSMGIAIPGGKFYLTDVSGQEITEPYTTGELVYEGENVTLGYAECSNDLEKGDERNGILQTGDMAQIDEDGFYYIVGRKKRFLKIYGNRVNLDEIERMIKAAFGNIDVASCGTDDHMYIFLTDGNIANKVREFVVNKTNLNPVAFKSIIVDEIPKNEAGKILYKNLVRYYG